MMNFTIYALTQLKFDEKLSTLRRADPKVLTPKNQIPIDGPHFIVGVISIFKQFNPEHYRRYIQHLAHYVKSIVHVSLGKTLHPDAAIVMTYLDELVKFDGESREVVT